MESLEIQARSEARSLCSVRAVYDSHVCVWRFHQAMMDRRYIELFPSSKQEMELAAAGMDPRGMTTRIV